MGCPRCLSGIGIRTAECRGRIEGILLQQSRMKPKQEEEPRGGRTRPKSVPMEPEKPTGLATQCGSSSGSGVQRDDATSIGTMQAADEKPPEAPMSRRALKTRAKPRSSGQRRSWVWKYACWKTTFTTMPRERRRARLRRLVRTQQTRTLWLQKVTLELNRLKALGRAYKAPSVDELMPLRYVYSQKTDERLDDRMVAESRERELSTLCSQDALFAASSLTT